ncbi:MAG: hypothetical protein JWP11_3816 [Frankiales bacterium]|nr:hypothetical protein [Frankiales bacterium]
MKRYSRSYGIALAFLAVAVLRLLFGNHLVHS